MAIYTYAANRRRDDFTSALRLDDGSTLLLGGNADIGANDFAQLDPLVVLLPGVVEISTADFPFRLEEPGTIVGESYEQRLEQRLQDVEEQLLTVESDNVTGLPSKVNRSRVSDNLQNYTDLDGATDNTAATQARINALSALASASKPKTLYLGEGVLLTTGIKPAKNVIIDARGCHIKKTAQDGTPQQNSLVRALETQVGGSYYGGSPYGGFKIVGGTWDSNGFSCPAGIIRAWFVEDFEMADAKIIMNATSIWAIATGGRDGWVHGCHVEGGTAVFQDGFHHCFGPRWLFESNVAECGDDAYAVGIGSSDTYLAAEAANGTLDAPRDVRFYHNRFTSQRGNAVRLYVDATDDEAVWRISDVTVRDHTGASGVLRNGGVYIESHISTVDSAGMVQDVDIEAEVDVGSAAHDGTNAYGVFASGADRVSINLGLRMTQLTGATGSQAFRGVDATDCPDLSLDVRCEALQGREGIKATRCTRLTIGDRTRLRQTSLAQVAMPIVALENCPDFRVAEKAQLRDARDGHSAVSIGTGTTSSGKVEGTIAHVAGATTGDAIGVVSTALTHLEIGNGADLSGSPSPVSAGALLLPSLKIGEPRGLSRPRLKRTLYDDFNRPATTVLGPPVGTPASWPTPWMTRVGTDPQCAAPSIPSGALDLAMRMTPGDDAAATAAVNGVQLVTAPNWRGDKGGLVCEFRVKIMTVTLSLCVFCGWTNDASGVAPPFTKSGSGDVVSAAVTNALGLLYDTNGTTDNWYGVGVATGAQATPQNMGVAPLLNVYETWRVELTPAGVATFRRNGVKIGSAMTGAIAPATALAFTMMVFARGAASPGALMGEYVSLEQNRS